MLYQFVVHRVMDKVGNIFHIHFFKNAGFIGAHRIDTEA
jgi:hypothetical protein